MVVLTGYAGQLSLAQYAVGGLCALFASRLVADEHWPAELAFLAGVAFAILVGVAFAIPALRTRGVNLAVVTLGLGAAVQGVIFSNQYFTGGFGSVTTIGQVEVFGWNISSAEHPQRYLVVCLVIFVVCGADGREPASFDVRSTAHRRAQQRTRGRVARHQRVRRQGVRVRCRRGARVVRRHPAGVQGHDRRLRPVPTLRVDHHRRQRGGGRHRLGARVSVRRQPRRRWRRLDRARLGRPRVVAHHHRRDRPHPHRHPEPERHRQRRPQRRARASASCGSACGASLAARSCPRSRPRPVRARDARRCTT